MNFEAMMNMMAEMTQTVMNPNCRDNVAPVDMNNWPQHMFDLSMETTMIKIGNDHFEGLVDQHADIIASYVAKVDEVMKGTPHFIKLNSRSPKDASYPEAPIAVNGEDAISLIVNSMRCCEDMMDMHMAGNECFIVLRKVVPIELSREMRCFAKDGKLIAATRYDYGREADAFWNEEKCAELLAEATEFYEKHIKASYDTVVFDLALGLGEYAKANEKHLLIELNPYGLSDPCVFKSYANLEATGGLAC